MHVQSKMRRLRDLTLVSLILLLTGCFGEGDGPQKILATAVPPTTGMFVDSPVSGAGWQTSGGLSGVTNDAGEFMYVPGENVTFSVGGIVLGSAPGAPIISAVELTGSNNPTDQAAVNLFVFLQSIDADQDPSNGITISSSTQAAAAGLTLDFTDPDFSTAVAAVVAAIAPGNAVVSEIDALAHFYRTYAALGGTDTFAFSFPGFAPVRSGVTYELVFAEEFNEGTAPDPEVWNYDLGYGEFGWGNNEWQEYTNSPDNVRIEDGNLVIQARCDTPPCGVRDGTVTSGRINTRDNFEFRYGTILARIKPPVGDGAWPAFWSLGANFPEIGWPRSGEIDFMEMHNAFSNERTTHFTMHWCDENVQPNPMALCFPQSEGWVFFTQNREFPQSLGDDFHIFEADWDQNRIIGRIDGVTYFERTIDPGTMEEFLREFFMILNVAMGGTLGSDQQPPNGNEVWPQTMLVDYVRVFQRTDAPTLELFIDFEGAPGDFTFNNFGGTPSGGIGGLGDIVMNPAPEGINTSEQVGRVRKFDGEVFAGTTLVRAFDVPARSAFTMKVWSPRPVNVLFKVEASPSAEVEVLHGGTGWEELTFDFGDFSGTATGITFIFDNGTAGEADTDPDAWTFYVDDIRRFQVLSQIDLPITFDDPDVDYTLTDFGDPVTAMTTLVDDPDDAGNTVASTTKPVGAPVWAGTTMSTPAGFASPIPFTASTTTIGVRVYSPAAGIPVRLKADDMVGEGAISVETELLTTAAGEWETLVFDFSDEVDGTAPLDLATAYRVLSIFFNFGTEGDDATYLWDDVEFGVALPDTTAPTLLSVNIASSNSNASLATTGDVVTVTLNADESIAAPAVTIGGVAADSVDGGGASWVASRTLTAADADGAVSFSIDFVDLAGNAGTPVTATTDESSVTLDATAPTLAILGAPAAFQTLDPIALTFQFSEAVTGFALNDIQRMGGGASGFTAVDADTYTVNLTPNGTADLNVAVAAGAAADLAGNATAAAVSVTILNELDAEAPLLNVVSISSSGNPGFARTGDVVTVSMTANEDIAAPTVTIAGLAADTVEGAGMNWQASRTMLASDAEGDIGFVINFEDIGGNAGPQTTTTTDDSSVVFDITAPTLTISGVPDPVQTLDPIAVTFEFSEDVAGFELGDIDVTSGSADTFQSVDGMTYTASVTPDGTGDLTVAVAADAAADPAGNGNETAAVTATLDLQPFWQTVWSDDFSGAALNTVNWTRRTDADCPDPCIGVQSYRAERVSVGAGLLSIEARDDVVRGGPTYTSGLIDTRGKRELQHGRIEIDVKLPSGTAGVTPSLWLLPATGEYGPWPLSGEIDIANAPDGASAPLLEHTLRYGLPEPEDTTATDTSDTPAAAATQFLTYALEWEAGEIRWFVDGVHQASQIPDNWYAYSEDADGVYTLGTGAAPFDQDFYLLISQAVETAGGSYPQTLQVDAVRVYRCANALDPDAGTGCAGLIDPVDPAIEAVVATNPPYNSAPYTESLEVYTNAPASLDFVDDGGMTTSGMLVPATFGTVTSTIDAGDMSNRFWNVVINATAGTGGVLMGPADLAPATGSFELTGGGTAGELLFRMRVNSATSDPQLAVGLDSDAGSGDQPLTFVADGTWRNYSVKIADVVTDSVMQGASLDLATLSNLFRLEAAGGDVNLDLDDISVKVACRDVGRCEATPRLTEAPPETVYEQDFELPGIDIDDTATLTNDGWLVFGNVFDGAGNFKFGYGVFGAPNGPAGQAFFSAIVADQGGPSQGGQQLSIFNDYNCCQNTGEGHFNGTDRVESLVFQERTIMADDVGRTYTFSWDAKADTGPNGLGGNTTALASLKTLDPMAGFAQTNFVPADMTNIPDTWQRYEVTLEIDAGLVGQRLQFGFSSTASNFEPSNVFYDNVLVTRTSQ